MNKMENSKENRTEAAYYNKQWWTYNSAEEKLWFSHVTEKNI